MKKAPPLIGYAESEYELAEILRIAHSQFLAVQKQRTRLEKTHGDEPENLKELFRLRSNAAQNGVVAVITAVSYLEAEMYRYATQFIHSDSYEEYVGSMSVVGKWVVLPKLCEGIDIDEGCTAINDLRELVKARNCIIHPKVKWLTLHNQEILDDRREAERFIKAATKALGTVGKVLSLVKRQRF